MKGISITRLLILPFDLLIRVNRFDRLKRDSKETEKGERKKGEIKKRNWSEGQRDWKNICENTSAHRRLRITLYFTPVFHWISSASRKFLYFVDSRRRLNIRRTRLPSFTRVKKKKEKRKIVRDDSIKLVKRFRFRLSRPVDFSL